MRLLAYVIIIRLLGPLVMRLAAIFGLLVALGSVPNLCLLLTVFFTSFFLAAAAFVINDYDM
jgi:4-hydroxybenzoate polyprenyltransferase